MSKPIDRLTIEGYRSIRKLENFELRKLNVLIGANGAGKSNFVTFFRLLRELIEQRLELAVKREGGADSCLHLGPQVTRRLKAAFWFDLNGYEFILEPTPDNRLVFVDEATSYFGSGLKNGASRSLGAGHSESRLKALKDSESVWGTWKGVEHHVYAAVSSWIVYHFHDTSPTALVRRQRSIDVNQTLLHDAENLAAFLYRIKQTHPKAYARIRDIVRLAAPFFDDFLLRPVPSNPHLIQLEWLQQGAGYPFQAHQLSDGTLRFMCLATALLQPDRPATVLFDEPELGLHPFALNLLGALLQQASDEPGKQIIVSTQSAQLLNEFAPEDIVVVDRAEGESVFRRLGATELDHWLEEYSLGELWLKNVLGGRPALESRPKTAV